MVENDKNVSRPASAWKCRRDEVSSDCTTNVTIQQHLDPHQTMNAREHTHTNLPVGDKDAEDELKDVCQECFRGHGHGQGHEQNEDSRTRGLHAGSSGLLNVCFSVGGNGVAAMAATFHRLFVVCRFKKSTHRKIVISGWREGRDEATAKQEREDQGHYLTRPPMPIPFFVGPWQPI
jgi:hypothetical protein